MANPFTLSFGKEPKSLIERVLQENEIIKSFLSEDEEQELYQVCMITGVRGCGKTVELTYLANRFKQEKDWIVIDLNPERDMLTMLAAALSNTTDFFQLFRDAKINLSVLGLGLEIDGVPPITDITIALDRMLEQVKRRGKKVLITIDEVSSTPYVREFISQFQILMRKGYSVYLIMTGLYENIYELQNEKSLTFLYRAPKIKLHPLNLSLIAARYKEIFSLSYEEACEMAKATKGYSFAFQVLGYLCWKNKTSWTEVLPEYDAYLGEYVYEKIVSELSEKDRSILKALAKYDNPQVKTLRDELGFNSSQFSVYRERLLRKGVISVTQYGHIDFVLPRFKEYINLYL